MGNQKKNAGTDQDIATLTRHIHVHACTWDESGFYIPVYHKEGPTRTLLVHPVIQALQHLLGQKRKARQERYNSSIGSQQPALLK
jgi:hypothetical protein